MRSFFFTIVFLVNEIVGEESLPDLSATVCIGYRGVCNTLPLDIKASHRIRETRVNKLGMIFMHISNVFKGTATNLGLESKLLVLSFVDVLDVAIVGGHAICDNVIRIGENFLDFGSDLLKSGGILHHFGSNSVNFLRLFPLCCVSGLNEGVHNELARSVNDGNRDYLISVIKSCKLKVEEKHSLTLHTEALGTVKITHFASLCKILLIAALAELFLESNVLSALNAHKGLTNAGLFVVEVELGAVLFKRKGDGLFNRLVVKLFKSLFCEKSVGGGTATAHSVNDSTAWKHLYLLLGIAEMPIVDICFFKRVGAKVEDNALVFILTERAGEGS